MSEMAALETAQVLETLAADPDLQAQQDAAFHARWGGVEDVRMLRSVQIHLPQGADEAASQTLERLRALERRYASPNLLITGYDHGVAVFDDEIQIVGGGPTLLTAEHATNPLRRATGLREAADQGTGALAAAVAQDGLAEALIMTGHQQGNAGITPDHPIKRLLRRRLDNSHTGFLSVHSKLPGQAPGLFDDSEVHAYLGLGRYEPRESTLLAAERITQAASDLGLRVMIGNSTYHPIYQKDPEWQAPGPMRDRINALRLDENGMPKMSRLAAYSAESTTSWLMRETEGDELHGEMPIVQMEIANSLCVTAEDRYVRDPKALAMGVHLGYLLTVAATEIIGNSSPAA